MSEEQEQGTPVWHAIVGDGWEPVQFGEETRRDDEVLRAGGWVEADYVAITTYRNYMMPRRRRQSSYEIQSWKIGADCWLVKGAQPGDRFTLTADGRMIPVDKPPTQPAE